MQSGSYLLKTDRKLGSREMFSSLPMAAAIERIYPNKVFVDAVADYLRKISKYVPVVWIGPRVEPHISQKYILRQGCCYNYKLRPNQYEVFQLLDAYIKRIVGVEPGISFISQNEMFGFKFPHDLITCDSIYWADGEHFSEEGEKYFGARFNLLNHYKR